LSPPAARGGRATPSADTSRRARGRASRRHIRELPDFIAPQTAMPTVWPPTGDDWLYEIDFDGERVVARRVDGHAALFTAAGDDCTIRYPAIARAVEQLDIGDAWLDGEAVLVNDEGTASGEDERVRYAVFDAMFVDGEDLRERALAERRERLSQILGDPAPGPLVFSGELAGDGASLLREACGLGLAGLIAKRRGSPYESGRSRSWRELKCRVRDELDLGAARDAAPTRSARKTSAPTPQRTTVKVAAVTITHPDRPIAHADGATKLDIVRYHERMAPWLLPQVAQRPLAVVRCTGGDIAQCFFQKHMGREQGNVGDPQAPYVLLPTLRAVIEAVQNGAFELHAWGASMPNIDRPDRITLDLDPDPSVDWPAFREAAGRVRALLDELGLRWFLKTTGGKGLHFVIPIERRYTWSAAKAFAASVARHLAAAQPDVFIATASKSARSGRVFVDYLRNAAGATAVAAYGLRARPGLPVSMPIEWGALDEDVRGAHFNWRNAADFVASRGGDPWAEYGKSRQRLPADALKRLGG
jgi:DNA ligase D-like protein (predicted polymerase)